MTLEALSDQYFIPLAADFIFTDCVDDDRFQRVKSLPWGAALDWRLKHVLLEKTFAIGKIEGADSETF
jgi:hypothetical protein